MVDFPPRWQAQVIPSSAVSGSAVSSNAVLRSVMLSICLLHLALPQHQLGAAPPARPAIALKNAMAPKNALTPQNVERAIQGGARYLLSLQRDDGSWNDAAHVGQPGGITALSTLALLSCGYTIKDRPIEKAVERLRGIETDAKTYSLSLQIMALCAADPRQEARLRLPGLVAQLQSTQVTMGDGKGGWDYGRDPKSHDPSNSQYALLALYEAERIGIDVDERTWKLALDYWQRWQRDDGSWKYKDDPRFNYKPSGSMTCAGIASLIIAHGELDQGAATWGENGTVQCCGNQTPHPDIERGIDWLSKNFSVRQNPGDGIGWYYYYMYGLERVGRMSGRRFLGDHDWYREGASQLLERQDELNHSWSSEREPSSIATAFALLFLSKGRRPILVSRLSHEPIADADRHPHDLAHLTQYVERRWRQNLTWQNIDSQTATSADLLQSPVLFLSGRDALQLNPFQKQQLRQYIAGGGFLFANACCDGVAFDREFRQLMEELFPESRLRFLEPDHPIWFAEQPIDEDQIKPLYGLDACCRTSVVYCPEDLSCLWELANPRQVKAMPVAVRKKVVGGLAIGANVLAYATNRQLRDKLDHVVVRQEATTDSRIPGALQVAKLKHTGGSHDAAAAVGNLMDRLRDYAQVAVATTTPELDPTDPLWRDIPIAFVQGRRKFTWNVEQRKAIREYLDRGGFVIADAICASPEFCQAFREEVAQIVPEAALRPLPATHPIFSEQQAFDLSRVQVRRPIQRVDKQEPLRSKTVEEPPTCEGVELNGRLVILFSPLDLSCAWENHPSLECEGYAAEDAYKLGINFVHFAMQQ